MSLIPLITYFKRLRHNLSGTVCRSAPVLIAVFLTLVLTFLFTFINVPAQADFQTADSDVSLFIPLTSRYTEWYAWMGPDGGTITALGIDQQHPDVVYAGTWGAGVFKSMDAGETWYPASRGLGTLYINSLAVDPKDPHVVFAGTYKGKLYKSKDGGANWFLSSKGVQDDAIVYDIAIDPFNTQNMYIATRGVSNLGLPPWKGVVYKSTDAGDTWLPSLINVGGATLQDWVYSLSIHPSVPRVIYAAAHDQGPYRSLDAGSSWEVVENGITDLSGRSIAIAPQSSLPAVVYFGVWYGGGVYKTVDGGDRWFQISNGVYENKVYKIISDPVQTSTLYLGTFTAGVMKTFDGGESWNSSGLYYEEIFSLALNPQNSQVVFAGTVGNGLFKSRDAGTTWQLSQKGLKGSPLTSLLVDSLDPQIYYVSDFENGVVRSTDHGETWLDYNTNLPDRVVNGLVEHPTQENTLYALTGSSGLYRRQIDETDGWIQIGEGLPDVVDTVLVSERLEAAYQDLIVEPLGMVPTTAYLPLLTMAFVPGDDDIAYLGTESAGVYKSLDGCMSWMPAGLPGESVHSLAIDFLDSNIIYAATDSVGGLYNSVDGGLTWLDGGLPERIVHAIALSSDAETTIYAGTDDGVYRQTDAGWKRSGLNGLDVKAIAIHPSVNGLIFAATQDGAYLSKDGGLHWNPVVAELSGIAVNSIIVDSRDLSIIYFITPSHGILRLRLSLH